MARPRKFTEDEVVARAADLFWANGYRRTTPKQLTEATGLSKGSLYNTFGSKAGLFSRAIERYVDEQRHFVAAKLDEPTLRGALEGLYAQIIATSLPPELGGMGRTCLMCTATVETDASEPELVAHVQAAAQVMVEVFRDRVDRAQRDGEVAADSDATSLAWFLYNTNMGMVVLARAGTPRHALERVAAQAIDTVLS